MKQALSITLSLVCLMACSSGRGVTVNEDPGLKRLTVDRLEKFESEEEFASYLRRVEAIAGARGVWWAGAGVQYAQLVQPPCDPAIDPACTAKGNVVVTAARREVTADSPVAATTASGEATITNVQKAGVDEGDIVKRIGKHLIVLQDGRLFSIDTSPDGADGLTLSDRRNVYRSSIDDSWYDEILVSGRRVMVTGYNYRENATQLSVLSMDERGRFTEEGVFFLSSNDYYDTTNYATRLVGDKLVIYSPIYLTDINPNRPMQWPLVRRWVSAPDSASSKRLFDARDIYKPLQPTLSPTIHTVSVCDLGGEAVRANLDCRTTAFVGPQDRTFYVSPDDVYVWVPSSDDLFRDTCEAGEASTLTDSVPAMVFKAPLSGASPKIMMTRGMPRDQFAMDTSTGEFRALVYWGQSGCNAAEAYDEGQIELKYFSTSMASFRSDARNVSRSRFVTTPTPGGGDYENRFTDRYVVYGGRTGWSDYPPEAEDGPQSARLVAVPVARPGAATVITTPHTVNRIERVGADIVATGYRDARGLSVSLIDLDDAPRLTDTLMLEERYESEGRSHAFNARLRADGGLMGLPTVTMKKRANRWWGWSDVSDVTFMSFDRAGMIAQAGALTGTENGEHPSYACEVSCIDWYGNARPIFIGERIYALTGTELVEGRLAEGQMREVRRLNLTAPVGGAKE